MGNSQLTEFQVDMGQLRQELEKTLKESRVKSISANNIPLVRQAEKVLKITYLEAKLFKSSKVGTEHILLAILREENNIATRILNKYGVLYENKDLKKSISDECVDSAIRFILNSSRLSPEFFISSIEWISAAGFLYPGEVFQAPHLHYYHSTHVFRLACQRGRTGNYAESHLSPARPLN